VRVQIYSLTHPEDVRACLAAGVDHIGVAAADQDVPASISDERARTLFDLVPEDRTTLALTVATDIETALEHAAGAQPDILHVCSATEALGVEECAVIRDRLPDDTGLMKAIDVADDSAIAAAERFGPVVDWLILDTATPDVEGVGASGRTHDWGLSRSIVDRVETPVMLAGGLSPGNVSEAVRDVRPAGVDSYSHTSRSEDRKDHDAVREFTENAKRSAAELEEDAGGGR
jgi:phosphoribosylanthranilate isomerase